MIIFFPIFPEIGKVEISETQKDQTKKSGKSNSKNTDPTPSAPPATDDQQFYDCELYVENELPKKKPKAGFVNPSSSSRTNFSSAPCVPQKDEYVESLKLITQVLGETEELRLKERVEKASGGLRTDKVYLELNGILTQKLEQLDKITIPSNVKSRLKIRVARENCVGMIEELLLKLDAKYPEHSLLEGGGCGDVFTTKAE